MVDLSKFGITHEEGHYHKEIIYTFALLYNIIGNNISNYLSQYNLSTGKLNILIALQRYGKHKGIKQVEVSEHLIVTPSNMTKMIDKMEKEGLVTRSSLAGDRRAKILKITTKGEKLVNDMWDGYIAKLKEAVNVLGKTKQKQLAELLTEWFEKSR